MSKKYVVYSAITGKNTDSLFEQKFKSSECDYILYTDNYIGKSKTYEVRHFPRFARDTTRAARMLKLLPHVFLPEYEYSVWIDGRVEILTPDLPELIDKYMSESNFAAFPHQHSPTLAVEVERCIERKKDNPFILKQQLKAYQEEGYQETGLVETGVLIRKHMADDVIEFDKFWWDQIQTYSRRDQISFPYAVWKLGFNYTKLPGYIWENDFFKVLDNTRAPKRFGQKYYIKQYFDYLKWLLKAD